MGKTEVRGGQIKDETITSSDIGPNAVGNSELDNSGDFTVNSLAVGAGNNGAPSLAFSGDTDTGIFNPSPNRLNIGVGGVSILSIGDGLVTSTLGGVFPRYLLTNDLDTGLFSGGANILTIKTGNSEAFRIDASQNVGLGGSTVTDSILSLNTTTKALLLPRMTTVQMDAIGTPLNGMIIFDTTVNQFMGYNGTSWIILG